MPVAVMTSESSIFTHVDGHTVAFCQEHGVDVEHLDLPKLGVRGNGHGMMLEKNNREALQPILDWLKRKL
jgi:hypothetical protein